MVYFADPVTERLNKALTKGFGSWAHEMRNEHGEWTSGSGQAADHVRQAEDADSKGDHEGAIGHLDQAHDALGDRITQGRRHGEHPADQIDLRDSMNRISMERAHQRSLAAGR